MLPDPFFRSHLEQSRKLLNVSSGCDHRASHGGFCGARIDSNCLGIDANGSVRVGLSASIEEWFAFLSGLGNMLRTSYNGTAILDQFSPVPALMNHGHHVLPRDHFGLYTPNLAEHAHLWAVQESSPIGIVHGLEVSDVSGCVFQRFIVASPHQREWFEQFVTDHQSPVEEVSHWFSPNHDASLQRIHAISTRSRALSSCATEARCLPIEVVTRLMIQLAKSDVSIRTSHFSRGLICSVIWKPECMEMASSDQYSLTLANDQVFLSLQPSAISEVWLWQGNCERCNRQHWTVELMDTFGNVSLAFAAGHPTLEAQWRELLKSCLTSSL